MSRHLYFTTQSGSRDWVSLLMINKTTECNKLNKINSLSGNEFSWDLQGQVPLNERNFEKNESSVRITVRQQWECGYCGGNATNGCVRGDERLAAWRNMLAIITVLNVLVCAIESGFADHVASQSPSSPDTPFQSMTIICTLIAALCTHKHPTTQVRRLVSCDFT